jgi:hypothetical protein
MPWAEGNPLSLQPDGDLAGITVILYNNRKRGRFERRAREDG